jgi:hemolysin activation/secretion protein
VAYGSASNSGFKETGRDRVIAEVSHADLWGLDHQVDLALTTSLENPMPYDRSGLAVAFLPTAGAACGRSAWLIPP